MNKAPDINHWRSIHVTSQLLYFVLEALKEAKKKFLPLNKKKSFQLGFFLKHSQVKLFSLFLMFKREKFYFFCSCCVTITIYSQSSLPAVKLYSLFFFRSFFLPVLCVCEYKVRHSEWEVQAAIFKWYFVCVGWKLIFWGGIGGGYWKCVYCIVGMSESEIQNEYLAKSISPTGL